MLAKLDRPTVSYDPGLLVLRAICAFFRDGLVALENLARTISLWLYPRHQQSRGH